MLYIHDFLKHRLRDNTAYTLQDDKVAGPGWHEKLYSGNGTDHIGRFYGFLDRFTVELNQLLQDEQFIREHVFCFGNEYEHNTSDGFLVKSGLPSRCILSTGNLVGFARYNYHGYSYNVNISSRFGDPFLKAMITDAEGFLEVENFGGVGRDSLADWILTYLWKMNLKGAYHLGLPKEYISKKEPLIGIRGNLNLNKLIINSRLQPPYECTYREHSYNNPVTQLVAQAFRLVRKKSLLADCMRMRQDFMLATEGKSLPLQELLRFKKVRNPYYSQYDKVAELSKMVIRNEMADFSAVHSRLSAFFFDVSMLFEYFIRKRLLREGYVLEDKNQELYSIPTGGNRKYRKLLPDLILKKEGVAVEVYDVKYKHFDFVKGVKREDLFQLHTYVGTILNTVPVSGCGFVFPVDAKTYKANGSRDVIRETVSVGGKTIPFIIRFFVVPDAAEPGYGDAFGRAVDTMLREWKREE